MTQRCSSSRQSSRHSLGEEAAEEEAVPLQHSHSSLEEIFPENPYWDEVFRLVEDRSRSKREHYGFAMKIKRLWRVHDGALQRLQYKQAQDLGKSEFLFHGTSRRGIKGILKNGFQLPRHSGMFGKGIYFAACPLKSVQYAKSKGMDWWQYIAAGLSGALVGGAACPSCSVVGGFLGACLGCHAAHAACPYSQMFLCEVFLGNMLTLRNAKDVDPSEELKRGWLPHMLGAQDYNSVHAPGGFFGAVQTTEYIVYRPHQAIPRWVIEFEIDRQGMRGHQQ